MSSSRSRESMEQSIILSSDDKDVDDMAVFSDDNFDGYCTPTGSTEQLSHFETSNEHENRHITDNINRGCTANKMELDQQPHTSAAESSENPENTMSESSESAKTVEEYEAEILSLTQQLQEANGYVDQVDVEAEQQYTELTGEIDELCALVEAKDNEITLLKKEMNESKQHSEQLIEQLELQKSKETRHTDVIDSMREDIELLNSKLRESSKENERIAQELKQMKQKTQHQKDDILAKELKMSVEIEEVQRELNKQREILSSSSMSDVIERWERRVADLESELCERSIIIHNQKSIINKLRLLSTSPPMRGLHVHSGGSSSESFQSQGLDDSSKSALFSFILSDSNAQLANVYSIGRILDLTSQEEQYLERHLADRACRL